MSIKDTIRKINTKVDILQKSLQEDDFNKKLELNTEDLKLPEFDTSKLGNKLEELKSKLKNKKVKKQNKRNILEEVVNIFSKILESGRSVADSERFIANQRLRQHVLDSVEVTSNSAKQIFMDCVKSALFAGEGICGGNSVFNSTKDSVTISPKEIDFLNMLKVDPESDYGKIMYEKLPKIKKEQVNRGLYNEFINKTGYTYTTPSEKDLFTATWNSTSQTFTISGLTQPKTIGGVITYDNINVGDFINDYYSNLEMPNLSQIIKNAMLLTVKAANVKVNKNGLTAGTSLSGMEDPLSWSPDLDDAINNLERMLNKLFAFCNNKNLGLSGQTATELIHENDEDEEFYFNFDDIEGIDLEDEDARKRKVLKFKDCNNFEVPYNATIIEDFVYLEGKLNNNDWIRRTLDKTATDAYEQSDFTIDLPNFQISINLGFIFNIPKAMIMSVVSPKMFLPIVIIYKLFLGLLYIDVKELMKKLKKLFICVITELYWKFLRELWKRLKVDLKNFLLRIIRKVLKDKLKRYYIVIMALIGLLKKIIETGIDNCEDLFGVISAAIDAALDASGGIKIPNVLLLIADKLPGFSAVKTHMEAVEKMNAMGIPTGDVNGEPNYLMLAFGANTDVMANNIAKTPFLFTNKTLPVLAPFGGTVPPMSMTGGALMKTS